MVSAMSSPSGDPSEIIQGNIILPFYGNAINSYQTHNKFSEDCILHTFYLSASSVLNPEDSCQVDLNKGNYSRL